MRLIRIALFAVLFSMVGAEFAPQIVQAAPVAASPLAAQTAAPDLTEKARVYCYNRYTGQFLHWGPCGGYRRHYYYRPRYYYRPHYHYYRRHYYRRYYW